jgi:DNA-binding MarR family transcriptional regulator
MPSTIYAVLIADVMESRARADLRGLLGKKLADISRRHLRRKLIQLPYSVTAGDEFQTVTRNLPSIPAVIQDLRTALRPLSLRIGVGFGTVPGRIQPPVNRLGGEAFQSARKAIESIKAGNFFKFEVLTAFVSRHEHFNKTMNLIYGLHDTLVLKITARQWETIEEFHETPTLEQTAKRLKLDPSTVSRNLKRGYYWQLAETVTIAGSLIKRTFC